MFEHLIKRLATPGATSAGVAAIVSLVVMVVIFSADISTDSRIRLHVLYIFPVSMVALHCERQWITLLAFGIALGFQIVALSSYGLPRASFASEILVAVAASILSVFLARTARSNYLAAIDQATTDSLTRLSNRRRLEPIIDLEIARQKRYGGVFSLVILDLDGELLLPQTLLAFR